MKPGIIIVGALVVGALGYIAFSSMGENLVYYWTPTEMAQAGSKAQGAQIRLGGMVVPGTLDTKTTPLHFKVTDNTTTVDVTTTAVPPQMFREGIGVVLEGTVGSDGVFVSDRLMVKHDEQYKPPAAGAAPDKEMAFKTTKEGS